MEGKTIKEKMYMLVVLYVVLGSKLSHIDALVAGITAVDSRAVRFNHSGLYSMFTCQFV